MGIEQSVAGRDLKDITHQGAMAYYSLIAAHANMIGLALRGFRCQRAQFRISTSSQTALA